MEIGPDGALYVLDYGSHWYTQNSDSRITRITYARGNLSPVAKIKADRSSGEAPMAIRFSATDSYDPDQDDKLSYAWTVSSAGDQLRMTGESVTFEFKEPGVYQVQLSVQDNNGASSIAHQKVTIRNKGAQLSIHFDSNRSFYYPNESYNYAIKTKVAGSGSNIQKIDTSSIKVKLHYLTQYDNVNQAMMESLTNPSSGFLKGKTLLEESDCLACHLSEGFSIGPSFVKISKRYKNQPDSIGYLSKKIITGGTGEWGEFNMPPHPQHTLKEAQQMVQYILSMSREPSEGKSLSLTGSFKTEEVNQGIYVLSAFYSDTETDKELPIKTTENLILRHPLVLASNFDSSRDVVIKFPDEDPNPLVEFEKNGAFRSMILI